jgi:hypothetical protein
MFLDGTVENIGVFDNQREGATSAVDLRRSFRLPVAPDKSLLCEDLKKRLYILEFGRTEPRWTVIQRTQARGSRGKVAHASAAFQALFAEKEFKADPRLQTEKTGDVKQAKALERTSCFCQLFET